MSHLIIALLFIVTAGGFYLSQRTTLSLVRQSNQAIATQLEQTRADWQRLTQQVAQAQHRLSDRRDELAQAREDLARVARTAQAIQPPPLDPAQEGTWPGAKPYFYLLKKHLSEVGYSPLGSDKHLTDEAGLLFGMSPAEKATVDGTIQSFRDAVQQLRSSRAQLEPPAPGTNSPTHQEITYQIPALTNEFQQLREDCEASLTATLGKSRADLFLEHLRPRLDQTYGRFGSQAYALTFYADRYASGHVNHQLRFTKNDRGGQTIYWYPVSFPLEPASALWDFRHLFGQEPLLTEVNAPGYSR